MSPPYGFSWVDKPLFAALARPESARDLEWLRNQGIDLVITLTEEPLSSHWINEAGLLSMHVPVVDFEAPTQEQLSRCFSAIVKARARQMGVAVHCAAGMGRTGVVVACYLVAQGMAASDAIAQTRRLRPGSIETPEQLQAVEEFARRRRAYSES